MRERGVTVAQAAVPQSVFTDSALHAELCEPLKPGEDRRKVCTPKDQLTPPPVRKKREGRGESRLRRIFELASAVRCHRPFRGEGCPLRPMQTSPTDPFDRLPTTGECLFPVGLRYVDG